MCGGYANHTDVGGPPGHIAALAPSTGMDGAGDPGAGIGGAGIGTGAKLRAAQWVNGSDRVRPVEREKPEKMPRPILRRYDVPPWPPWRGFNFVGR
jgi:hypothetical protein